MYAYEQCKRYRQALAQKNLDAIMALFTPDATVKAPLSGNMDARTFHERLFRTPTHAITKLTNVFDGLNNAQAIALQFCYVWILKNGERLEIDGMTVFEMDMALQKFTRMTVIYDPTLVRRHLEEAWSDGEAGVEGMLSNG